MTRAAAALALMLIAAMPGDDGFDRAAAALAAGSRAADSGDRPRLRAAALALRASAAQPVAGDDMAARWLRETGGRAPPPERDRALGPGYRALRLGGGDSARFEQTFLAGQLARVAVIPVHQADFTLRVSDARTPLCSGSPGRARCDWVPSYTTRFMIEIVNPGRDTGQYFVMMQ